MVLSKVMGHGPLIQHLLSGALIALGYIVLVGWVTRQAWMVQPLPHMPAMVASSALCFAMAGIALVGVGQGDALRRSVVRILGAMLIAIPLVILAQDLFAVPQLFDWTKLHGWLDDGNPTSGRMDSYSRVGFMLEGVVLLALSRERLQRSERTIPIALLVLVVIAAAGLLGSWLATDLVFLHMAIPTALGMLAMALCSWEAWKQRVDPRPAQQPQPADRIVGTSAVILIVVALIAGVSGFALLEAQLLWMILLLAALIAFGLLLLRSKVHPLAIRLASSEVANREAHDEIAAIVGGIADGLITVDESSRIVAANPAAGRMFGHAGDGLVGRDFNELLPLEFRAARSSGMRRYIMDGAERIAGRSVELVGLRKDGSEFPIELSVDTVKRSSGYLYVGVVRDATARQKAGQALLLEKERLRVTLHSIGDAVITTDTHGVVTYMNPVAEQLVGWRSVEAIGQRIEVVYAIVHAAFGDRAQSPVSFVLTTGAVGGKSDDTILVRRDGTRVDIDDSASPIRDGDGTIVGVVLVFRDATQARRLTGRINHQATHDALTDLMNRREFERQLTATLDGEGPQSHGHVLLFIDLDQFKIVNDTAGHAAGDKLLKQVSGLLKGCLRSSDQLARMGGDEFAVLLRDCPIEPGIRVAEALRQIVADIRFDWEGSLFRIGASIGLVHFEAGAALSQLLSEADSACYLAKDKGRNRIYVHNAVDEDVMRRSGELNWTSRIHAALADNRFVLFAQKIVPVSGARNREAHYELLVRMRDQHGELVPPTAFIPAAERYGLMPAIDRWVVAHALENLAMARARGAKTMLFSINLSGTTLADDGFIDFVEDQFRLHGVPHDRVCFEITETAAISNLIQAGRFIGRLKQLGCKFSLDDLGAGMSSFTYLKHLQVDFLKIDGSFVRNIVNDEIDASMVDAINRVGHVMGIKTVAEFVEDDAILQRLRFIGVDYAQGYGIDLPCPLASIMPPRAATSNGDGERALRIGGEAEQSSATSSRWNAK